MKIIRYAIILVLVATVAVTVASYPQLPDTVVSHWNAAGEADGSLPKFWGLALIPLLMIGFSGLFALLPRIDPLMSNYQKFQGYYEGFILIMALFFFAIQMQVILWGLGMRVSPNLAMPLAIGMLFIYIGFLIEHAEPNWFVGIRTPWTLSSGQVWKKTHDLGGKLFKIAGVISCAGILFQNYAFVFIILPVLAVSVITVVYSYLEFRKIRR